MSLSWSPFRSRARAPSSAPAPLAASPESNDTLDAQLRNECEAMARFALRHGLPVPPEAIAELARLIAPDEAQASRAQPCGEPEARHILAALHGKLSSIIAPATPQAVLLLDAHYRRPHPFAWLGPVPLIRLLSAAAIAFLVAVVATGLSPDVSSKNIEQGFLDASGASLLWNTLFLLFCAGLGASFAALFQAHRYIAEATYDPRYDASYGARLILGVIAGLILVEMLPRDLFASGGMRSFGKPALAMLGGFSATAVHRLLQRLVDTLDALVKGDPAAGIAAMRNAERAQTAQTRTQMQSEIAAQLVNLQQALENTASTDEVKRQLAVMTQKMLGAEPVRPSSPAAPQASAPADTPAS